MRDKIDEMIRERAGWIYRGGPAMRPIRGFLHLLLGYDRSVELAEFYRDKPAHEIMDHVGEMIARKVRIEGLDNIPREGPAVLVSNHPTGIADGIILWSLLREKRPDLFFFANRDVNRIFPQFESMIAPVEWREEKRSHKSNRETLAYAKRAFGEGRLGVIFPSGRIMKRRGLGLQERPWMNSAAMIARKMDLPVVPLRMTARNSALFYLFDLIHPTLRDITLFHEVLNKHRQPFSIRIGDGLQGRHLPADSDAGTDRLFRMVERLRDPVAEDALVMPTRRVLQRFRPAKAALRG
ncbi:MAG: 1-acyl-sn-glycerol-3-phosphate acyltransferase [Rubricella sp.]